MKYLFCLLIPIGLFLFIISVKGAIRFAKSEMIYEMPYESGIGTFTLTAKGKYGLWLSGQMFRKSPAGEFGLILTNACTGQSISLCAPLVRTVVNGFDKSRMELYSFQAEPGTYRVSFSDEARIRDKVGAFLANTTIKRPIDGSLFSIQVYRHTSHIVLALCILGILFGAAGMIAGIALPIIL